MKLSYSANRAFTLVETLITMSIVVALFLFILKFSGHIRTNVVKSDADLQNIKEARLALNSLRRDFSVSTPLYGRSDKPAVWQGIRVEPLICAAQYNNAEESKPMIVASKNELHFYRYENEKLINVSYVFDSVSKTLNRVTPGKMRSFRGIKSVQFSLFSHSLGQDMPSMPMLWVELTFEHKEGGKVRDLELSSIMVSSITGLELDNLAWNRQY